MSKDSNKYNDSALDSQAKHPPTKKLKDVNFSNAVPTHENDELIHSLTTSPLYAEGGDESSPSTASFESVDKRSILGENIDMPACSGKSEESKLGQKALIPSIVEEDFTQHLNKKSSKINANSDATKEGVVHKSSASKIKENLPSLSSMTKVPIETISQYILTYRTFLQRYRPALHIVEDTLSRIVLYAPSRFVFHADVDEEDKYRFNNEIKSVAGSMNEKKIQPESLYALINLWSLLNDSLYHGIGIGNGLTVGSIHHDEKDNGGKKKKEGDKSGNNERKFLGSTFQWKNVTSIVPILRAILAIVECIAPALEVSAYASPPMVLTHHLSAAGVPAPSLLEQGNRKNKLQEIRHGQAMNVVTKILKVKFCCRILLLVTNYVTAFARMREKIKKNSYVDGSSNRTMDSGIVNNIMHFSVGILDGGGHLHPGEYALSIDEEEERVKKMLYVGRRTGRRVARNVNGHTCMQTDSKYARSIIDIGNNKLLDFLRNHLVKLGLLAFGEVLHIYRPLYWAQSRRNHSSSLNSTGNLNRSTNNYKSTLLKAWITSFAMDIISHQLSIIGTTVKDTHTGTYTNIASNTTKEELQRRKARLMLYLLRPPIWKLFTRPSSSATSNIMNWVPLVGAPLGNYFVELLTYWQKWNFMLED